MQKQWENSGLLSGDKPLIAHALGISLVTVADILKNRRGKRSTLLQQKVRKAAEFCIQKNKEKVEFCLFLSKEE